MMPNEKIDPTQTTCETVKVTDLETNTQVIVNKSDYKAELARAKEAGEEPRYELTTRKKLPNKAPESDEK